MFNGEELIHLNSGSNKDKYKVIFEECDEFYSTQKGVERNTAKMFYKFIVIDKEINREVMKFRVELRSKGSLYASPQFQLHKI